MKKNSIDLYFIDLDGTTLDIKKNKKHWISENNIKAIHDVRSRGKEVIISTGRHSKGMNKLIQAIGGRYSIMSNGAEIMDNHSGKLIFNKKLNMKQIIKITDFAKKHNLSLRISGEWLVYGATNWWLKFIAKRFHTTPKYAYTFDQQIPRTKIMLWGKINTQKMEILRRKIENEVDDIIALTTGKGFIIEITHITCTKGLAEERIAKKLSIPMSKAAHIGDTMNDSTALDKVGTFIAMQNSSERLKSLANYIGPHYKKAGLSKILLYNEYAKKNKTK